MDKSMTLQLPIRIISPTDLNRVIRELDVLDNALYQASVRSGGESVNLPRTSRMLEDLAFDNKCSLLSSEDRQKLLLLLKDFSQNYPKVHMSFTVEPSARFVEKIIVWLRNNIHGQILLDIGLQPSIAAGCIVRTKNKVFDLSLRNNLSQNRHLLIKSMENSVE